MENNTNITSRPGMENPDTFNEALYNKMASIAKWTAPCTFARTEKAPIDSKSIFETLDNLNTYINDPVYGTAYPGQIVAVTNDLENNGVYVLSTKLETIETVDPENPEQTIETQEWVLYPVRLGTKAEIEAASSSAVMNWLDQNGHEI